MRNSLLIIFSLLIFYACDSDTPKKSAFSLQGKAKNPETVATFSLHRFDTTEVLENCNFRGEIVYGRKWTDANGINILVLSQEKCSQNIAVGLGSTTSTLCDKFLYASHFVKRDTSRYIALHTIADQNNKPCPSPPMILEASFYETSISITDINNNNFAEVTLMYFFNCTESNKPASNKLVMIENNQVMRIEGTNYIPKYGLSGQRIPDKKMRQAPELLRAFAFKTWEKFSPTSPIPHQKKQIDIQELSTQKFKGNNNKWELSFTKNHAVLKQRTALKSESFYYTHIKSTANTLVIEAECRNSQPNNKISIQIYRKLCSDGLSKTYYPYAIELIQNGRLLSGCGGNS